MTGPELLASILAEETTPPADDAERRERMRIGKGFRLGDLTITVVREKDDDDYVLTVGFQVKGAKRIEGHFRGRERKEFLQAVQDAIHGQSR